MNAEDEAIARLRAADPAGGAEADLVALRAAVDARIGQADVTASGAHDTRSATDELTARRTRRSRRNAWMAGVAASVLVGATGYALGANTSLAGGGGDQAAYDQSEEVAEAADGSEEQGGDVSDSDMAAEESAVESGSTGDSSSAAEDPASTMLATGRAEFVASGLSAQAGSSEGFAYDPTGVASADEAQRVAAALGIEGDVIEEGGSWMVAGGDGRVVHLSADGAATFSYSDPSLDPFACAARNPELSDPDSPTDSGDLGTCTVDGAELPPPSDPVGDAQAFLTTIGVDVDSLDLVVETAEGGLANVVGYQGAPVDGVAAQWYLTVRADGVYSAWGPLAPLVSLGEYDVISPVAAVERLMDPRFGAGGAAVPLPAADGLAADGSAPAPPEPGSAIAWPVETYTITDATLTLGSYTQPDGAVVLLPTWSLTAAEVDGATWTVVALTDDSLDFDS